jgi:ADP-ribosyl-[dinitrogen reductase] hydrolase
MIPPAPLLSRDRLVGGLLGLVVGDALGVPVEFGDRAERDRDPVRGMRGFGTHLQPVGAWSDDGAMAMAHAAAFIEHGWDPRRHLEAFCAWREHGAWTAHGSVFDIGNATRAALDRFRHGRPIGEVGGRRERDNGNGSLMRILPVSCWWAGAPIATAIDALGEASALTHAHIRSQLCCMWHALIVDGLLSRRTLPGILADAGRVLAGRIPDGERRHFASLADGSCLDLARPAVPSDGHVVSTLIAACWCLHRHESYAEAVLEAVNLGDDTDTTAAVTGGLAGLRSGLTGIPHAWVACLARRVAVLDLAERFAEACLRRGRRV